MNKELSDFLETTKAYYVGTREELQQLPLQALKRVDDDEIIIYAGSIIATGVTRNSTVEAIGWTIIAGLAANYIFRVGNTLYRDIKNRKEDLSEIYQSPGIVGYVREKWQNFRATASHLDDIRNGE